MPDGDRFERSLRGKGWRKAYRQVRDDAPPSMLRDTLVTATAAALRGPFSCSSLAEIGDAVYDALRGRARSGELKFSGGALLDPYRSLSERLSEITKQDGNSISTQLAAKAGESVYIEFANDCAGITTKDIRNRFAEIFGEKVVRHLWLARVRDGILLKSNRTVDEQMAWEKDLLSQLTKPLSGMVGQMFRTDRKVAVRAPRRSTPQRKMTIEELHKGIAVQEV